jgi:hypothetical protein
MVMSSSHIHLHPESLALRMPAAVADETRQDPAHSSNWDPAPSSSSGFGAGVWNDPVVHGNSMSGNIWGDPSSATKKSYAGGAGEETSLFYSASTNPSTHHDALSSSAPWYPPSNTNAYNQYNMNDLSATMSHLQLSHANGDNASVASMTSTSVPGVVGASSGSTGGSTAMSSWNGGHFSNQQLQPPLQMQGSYPTQQFRQEQQHFGQPGNLPGFDSAWSHGLGGEDYPPLGNRGSAKKSGGRGGGPRNKGNRGKPQYQQGNRKHHKQPRDNQPPSSPTFADEGTVASSKASSEAIRMLMKAPSSVASLSSSQPSVLTASRLPLERFADIAPEQAQGAKPILPAIEDVYPSPLDQQEEEDEEDDESVLWKDDTVGSSPTSKKSEWLLRMNRRMAEIPVGELDPSSIPISAIMNAWAKTKSAKGASIVETWLNRAQQEFNAGNDKVIPTTKMYTMAGKFFKE